MVLAAIPPSINQNTDWFSSNSASIAPGALIILLIDSVLDALFYGAAAQGVLSPWMQGGKALHTKQSGQTHVVHSDFNGAGKTLSHDWPRQLDALVNVGLVLTLPAIKAGSAETATLYSPSEKTVDGADYADANTVIGGAADRGTDFKSDVVLGVPAATGTAPNDKNWVAYCSFAQYAIIETVKVDLNNTALLSFTGQDLLIIQDVYGAGKHGIDVVSNTLFNTNDYIQRGASALTATTHVISLSLWFEYGSHNAMLLSSHAYSPLHISVKFKNLTAILQKSASSKATYEALNDADFKAAFIYDSYYMGAAEKEIVANTNATVPYRKVISTTVMADRASGTNPLNFNFVGGDVIAYAVDTTNNACGKTGQFGLNDSQRSFLKSFKLSINHNECHEVNAATSKWHMLMGATHLPSLGALYFTPSPGMDLDLVKSNKPFATIPWSRLENAGITFETDLNNSAGTAMGAESKNVAVHVLSQVYSALARGNGVANQVYQ